MRRPVWRTSTLAALLVCLTAGVYTAITLAAASNVSVIAPQPQNTTVALRAPSVPDESVAIWDVVDSDPFREDRSAAGRYRLPGTGTDSVKVEPSEPALAVVLLGTVMSTDGTGFALCQLGADAPKLLRPGQSIGGLTLRRVEQAKATFAASDGQLSTLVVPKGGAP